MSWVETKLKVAKDGWLKVRGKINLEEYLDSLKVGFYVHKPEGYTYEWLREEMIKFKDEK